jgi:hypothetical protein
MLYFQGKKIPENAMTMHPMQKSHSKFQECNIVSLEKIWMGQMGRLEEKIAAVLLY